jgi:tripartite-type tricarboxylate transporter receptor subunit TctC
VDLTSAHEQIKAGNLTALGVTSAHRAKTAPEIPTIAEGGVPGFDGSAGFIGLLAPVATPPERIKEVSRTVAVIMARQDVQARIALLSVEPAYENETRFGDFLNAESKKWGALLASLPQQK